MISVSITAEDLGILDTVAAQISGNGVARVAARGVRNRVQERFQELEDTKPNRRGWPRQHLWAQMRRATQTPIPAGAGWFAVDITHVAAAQIYWGGRIRPVNSEALTMPANAQAYGHRAREFNDLKFGFAPNPELDGSMMAALVQAPQTAISFGRKKKDGTRSVKTQPILGGTVFFWLTREVNQDAFPEMLPTPEQLKQAAIDPASEYVRRVVEEQKAGEA